MSNNKITQNAGQHRSEVSASIRSFILKKPAKAIINRAVVAYIDVLGFSYKRDDEDLEYCLLDFNGPLQYAAESYPRIRFNIFSDCAFLATSLDHANDILSVIRFAFSQWIADGILVRGGLAIGDYKEARTFDLPNSKNNYIASLFFGTGVVRAVKLERSGRGALLFIDNQCADFYNTVYGEPIFTLENRKIIDWSNDLSILFWFAGISLLRAIKFLSKKKCSVNHSPVDIYINNILYSMKAISEGRYIWSLVLAILSLPDLDPDAKRKVMEVFQIKDPDDFNDMKELIEAWLDRKTEIALLRAIADMDSTIMED